MENKIILVGGYNAAGKTLFSDNLSKLLNIPCFNKDSIKEVLGDGFGSEDNIVVQKGTPAAFLLMLHIAEKMLQAYNSCILEGAFDLNEIRQIKILLEKYNCECLTFIFTGDFETLYKRHMQKNSSEKRHRVHTTTFENVNYDELYNIAKDFIDN